MTLNTKQINRYAHDIRGREKENIKLTGEEKIGKEFLETINLELDLGY